MTIEDEEEGRAWPVGMFPADAPPALPSPAAIGRGRRSLGGLRRPPPVAAQSSVGSSVQAGLEEEEEEGGEEAGKREEEYEEGDDDDDDADERWRHDDGDDGSEGADEQHDGRNVARGGAHVHEPTARPVATVEAPPPPPPKA